MVLLKLVICTVLICSCSDQATKVRQNCDAVDNTACNVQTNADAIIGTWKDSSENCTLIFENNSQGILTIDEKRAKSLYTRYFEFSWSLNGAELQIQFHTVTVIRNSTDIIREKSITKQETITLGNKVIVLDGIDYYQQ